MTLTDRNARIDATFYGLYLSFPYLSPSALAEITSMQLARDYGLAVTPDEITRVLSALAEPVK